MKAIITQTDDFAREAEVEAIAAQPGSYRLQFSHYAQVPMSVQQQLVARHAPAHRDED